MQNYKISTKEISLGGSSTASGSSSKTEDTNASNGEKSETTDNSENSNEEKIKTSETKKYSILIVIGLLQNFFGIYIIFIAKYIGTISV